MKLKNIVDLSSLRLLTAYCLIVACVPVMISCQSRELSRSQAEKLIVSSTDYKQIKAFDYISNAIKKDGQGTGEATAADETEASAIQNRINEYYWEEPRVQVASYLGLVEPKLKRKNDVPQKYSSQTKYGFWFFDESWVNTPKGEKLWADVGLPTVPTVVPLAKKEFVGITGIAKRDETIREVEFTWKWVPNELGKSLDPSTDEYKALPEAIRSNITEQRVYVAPDFVYDWGGERRGAASFRRYDDGWRLESVVFM